MTTCTCTDPPTAAILWDYLLDKIDLPPGERVHYHLHLMECPECRWKLTVRAGERHEKIQKEGKAKC